MEFRSHIGLDIGSTGIKLAQVAPISSGRFKLLAIGQVETPLFSDQMQWDQACTAIIKKLVKDVHVSTNQVAISLPETQVYTRVIEMPLLAEPDLTSTIRFQAEQYIPVPLADVVLKHQILASPQVGVPGSKMSVLLVAAPNEILTRYQLMLSNAGLEVMAIETEILASARAVIGSEQSLPVSLLVLLGAESSTLAVFKGGLLTLVQSVNTGESAVVRAVGSKLGLDFRQAGNYVRSYGLDKTKLDGKVAGAVEPVVELILTDIRRAIAFYQAKEASSSIARVVLVGGMALLPGLVEHFVGSLGLEVQLGNPFVNFELSEMQKKEVGDNGPDFATVLGLAVKEL